MGYHRSGGTPTAFDHRNLCTASVSPNLIDFGEFSRAPETRMNRALLSSIGFALILPLLSGCAAVVVGGAATGLLVAHDRRTSGTVIQDQEIEISALNLLGQHPDIKERSHISITSYNLRVLLTGEAETDEISRRFAQLMSRQPQVASVYNEVTIGPEATLGDETEDTYLTSKVKLALFDVGIEGFDPTFVKVVTARGSVFLMGLVTREEGQAVLDKVRTVRGVERVVEVFEYIDS